MKLAQRVLFLGYGPGQTGLIEYLRQLGCTVDHTADPIASAAGYDLVVSFGYKHILRGEALLGPMIVNLHIAYLPFNRGYHPNYWAHVEGTPSGVTIHQVDAGIDTGPILWQRQVTFAPDEDTFAKTYQRLLTEMELLFIEHAPALLSGSYALKPQTGPGSHHFARELPADFPGWDTPIAEYLSRPAQRRAMKSGSRRA